MSLPRVVLPVMLAIAAPLSLHAQLAPPSSGGLVAVERSLRFLGAHKRVLLIGAHPDDEDTELLTVLVRGSGAEAAYLSLTRGEGGQNLIGPELGEGLGLIRTEELLAAREIDGARQFFTRAYDFGYSKTLADVWLHWPSDSVLKDVVRVVRRFRPQVIVTIFSGTPRDGHGQHQAAGWAAREAWRVAGDPAVFPELAREEGLQPWRPLKLYQSARFSASADLTLPAGELDPAAGQSYHQLAMRSRSQHRSQDMGRLQEMGPSSARMALVDDRTGAGLGGVFAGVDTTFGSLVGRGWPADARRRAVESLRRYRARVDSAKALPRPDSMRAIAAVLTRGWGDMLAFLDLSGRQGAGTDLAIPPSVHDQGQRLATAVAAARGLVFDMVTDRAVAVPGEPLRATLLAWNTSSAPIRLAAFPLQTVGTLAQPSAVAGDLTVAPGAVESLTVTLEPHRVAADPYFLQQPRDGDLYRWVGYDAPKDRGVFGTYGAPFETPPLMGSFSLLGDSVSLTFRREAAFRRRDQALGEVRAPVAVYPRIDVALTPDHLVLPAGGAGTYAVEVALTNHGTRPARGTVRLDLPAGWPALAAQRFLLGSGGDQTLAFELRVPGNVGNGTFRIRAIAEDENGTTYDRGVVAVRYPHIRTRTFTRTAETEVHVARLIVPSVGTIAYVRGAADRVPEALRTLGLDVAVIDPRDLAGDLSRYAAIVVGSRAYEVAPELGRHNDRLLAFARQGGLVLVQYQQYAFFDGGFAPFPLSVGGRPLVPNGVTSPGTNGRGSGHDRVADETAAVRILDPADPSVATPNRLGPADWEGWVQERGLYFARSWDKTYRTVLEMRDPGEDPLRGGLLIAPAGEGTYVYTGMSFFRQLPAGVPGAYRLFLNLLAMAPRRGVS